ncbi:MAG: hypothetical protein ACK4QL_01675 [Pseudanabaenaceae cyanobacterium]
MSDSQLSLAGATTTLYSAVTVSVGLTATYVQVGLRDARSFGYTSFSL